MKKPFYKNWVFIIIIVAIVITSIIGYYISKEKIADEKPESNYST